MNLINNPDNNLVHELSTDDQLAINGGDQETPYSLGYLVGYVVGFAFTAGPKLIFQGLGLIKP